MFDIEEIRKRSEKIKNQKSWIKKSVQELIDELNEKIGEIRVKENIFLHFKHHNEEDIIKQHHMIRFGWGIYGGNIALVETFKQDDKWIINLPEKPEYKDVPDLRYLIEKLPAFLEHLMNELEKIEEKNDETINEIERIFKAIN